MSPRAARRYPVEAKVKASSGTALAAAFITAWVIREWPALADEPGVLQALILAVVTGVAALGGGYAAHHTPRPAPPPADRR